MSKFVAFLLSSLFLTTYAEVDTMVRSPTCLLHDDKKFKSAVNKKHCQIPGNLNCHEMKYVPTAWPSSFPYMISLRKTVETKCETHLESLFVKLKIRYVTNSQFSRPFFLTVSSGSPTNLSVRLTQSHDCSCYVSRLILAPLPLWLHKYTDIRHKTLALSRIFLSGLLTLPSSVKLETLWN